MEGLRFGQNIHTILTRSNESGNGIVVVSVSSIVILSECDAPSESFLQGEEMATIKK
jgi:hypothetical protein